MAKSKTELTTIEDEANASVPAYLREFTGSTGAEDIDTDDVNIPRIKLAQALTPEVQAGLVNVGDLFLNVTGEVLAKAGEPLRFVPVAVGKEYILWNPERGEGILARAKRVFHGGQAKYMWDKQDEDFNVKFRNGPKVTWSTKRFVEDNGLHRFGSANPGDPDSGPAATAHHNFVVVLPDHGDMVAALSLSRSQEKRAKDLNAMFKMSKVPIYGRVFTVNTVKERSGAGDEYYNYKFKPAGFVEDASDFSLYSQMFDGFKSDGFQVDQSGSSSDEGTSI